MPFSWDRSYQGQYTTLKLIYMERICNSTLLNHAYVPSWPTLERPSSLWFILPIQAPTKKLFSPGWRRQHSMCTSRPQDTWLSCRHRQISHYPPAFIAGPGVVLEIELDLDPFRDIQYLHQGTNLAMHCYNTRATHLARSLQLHIIFGPSLSSLESAFN